MNLRSLSDDEFLSYANANLDELTSTELEKELLKRFEQIQEDYDLELLSDVQNFLETEKIYFSELTEAYSSMKTLKEIADDTEDGAFDRLSKLIKTLQE